MSIFGFYNVSGPGGADAGGLEVEESGLYARFRFTGPLSPRPARLWLLSGGKSLPLGIPVPRGAALYLEKMLPVSGLGLEDIEKAELMPLEWSPGEDVPAHERPPEPPAPSAEGKSGRVSVHFGGKIVEIKIK